MKATPPSRRRAAGLAVEDEVAAWLEARGYAVLDRNFLVRGGEVDLVVATDEVLAFVEVRSRVSDAHGRPEETVGRTKIRRVVTAARHWLARHDPGDRDLRFDVVAVLGPPGEREITHFPAAFEAPA